MRMTRRMRRHSATIGRRGRPSRREFTRPICWSRSRRSRRGAEPALSVRMGVLTPSSNTVLEPLTAAMAAEAGATAHFARFPVTEISLGPDALRQFDHGPMLTAAGLLADARMHVIVWSGTSAGWLGFD